MNDQIFDIGDLVKIADNAPMGGENAFVYEVYDDFDEKGQKGVSLITESGRDTGGWSREEQRRWLTLVKRTNFYYSFKNVIQLAEDFRNGVFDRVLPGKNGDGHYCVHHPDDPTHGDHCYEIKNFV